MKQPFWVIVGTRPEVIKQIPVYWELKKKFGDDQVALIGTGQHKELLEQALSHFSAKLDYNLELMQEAKDLPTLSAKVLEKMGQLFLQYKPRWVIVQGDTTTAAMAAWAGFLTQTNIAHNEAGLRSNDLQNPYPEEANRRLISLVSKLHFAPTQKAQDTLLKENTSSSTVHMTGNTGIDALFWTLEKTAPPLVEQILSEIESKKRKPVLLTAHRRESQGTAIDDWFQALSEFSEKNPELEFIYPTHPNGLAKTATEKYFLKSDRFRILAPLDYNQTCHLLKKCFFTVTDSGGIQEEGATLGIPVVVCRRTTERSEAVDAGISKVVGFEKESILAGLKWANALALKKPGRSFVFGDGTAGKKIAKIFETTRD